LSGELTVIKKGLRESAKKALKEQDIGKLVQKKYKQKF
jgi:hypothetical protein